MKKIITLIMFLLAVAYKTTAMAINDTTYYECWEKVSYDTIPYMVKDKTFFDGLNELLMIFNGKRPYSLKRAEFIVEWAYSGGKLDYSKFCKDIDNTVHVLKKFIRIKNVQQYKTAPNFALSEYFTKPSSLNGNRAFSYDFEDFTGKKKAICLQGDGNPYRTMRLITSIL